MYPWAMDPTQTAPLMPGCGLASGAAGRTLTPMLWKDRAGPGAKEEEQGKEKIMKGQVHPDL